MGVKPLQDMLLAEPELSRLGRQDTTSFLIRIELTCNFYIFAIMISNKNLNCGCF